MADKPVTDMSREELRQLIRDEIASQLARLQRPTSDEIEDAMAWLDNNLIDPKPGTPSTAQLLREDRDR